MCIHSIGCIYCLQLVRGMPTLYLNRPKLPIVPHNLLRKIILSQLKCLCTYVNSLDYHSFIVSFEVSYYGSSNFFVFSKIVFLRTLHINFIISLSISTKKKKFHARILNGIIEQVSLIEKKKKNDILTIMNLPIHKHDIYPHLSLL